MPHPTPLIVPGLANAYGALAPVAEAVLRVVVGFALVPHGLRMTFGWFPHTGLKVNSLKALGRRAQSNRLPSGLAVSHRRLKAAACEGNLASRG
jgi:hypothetical protein